MNACNLGEIKLVHKNVSLELANFLRASIYCGQINDMPSHVIFDQLVPIDLDDCSKRIGIYNGYI